MRPTTGEREAALQAHGERVGRYRDGRLTDDEFRPIRLSYGLYYQLDHTSYMQRIKLPAGVITAAQADALAAIAEDYARAVLHVTTRQDIQLHWLALDDVMPMYERLHAVGISTRGACSDSIRNITGCSHAGFWPGEPFDVTPYVFALDEYFLFHPLNLTLPRKFKIAVAGCPADCVQARTNDIAFFPHVRDGRRGFAVYAGGGLGSQPFLARPVREFVPVEDLLIVAEAIVRLQHRDGERANRKKARMKYVFQRLGAERFRAEVDALAAEIEAAHGDALRAELEEMVAGRTSAAPLLPPAPAPAAPAGDFARWLRTNTVAQRQAGYFAATVTLPLGDLTSAQLRVIAGLARQLGAGEMRATNDQNLLLPWLPGGRLREVYETLCDIGLGEPDALHITDVTSCPGADYCSLAVSRSMGMAEAIRREFRATNGAVEALGVFRVKISGCPNACGQHHIGDIGLTGLSLKGPDGQHHPHYSMLVGGRVGETAPALGKRLPLRLPAPVVPRVIRALADAYRTERRENEAFADYVERVGVERLVAVAGAAAGGEA